MRWLEEYAGHCVSETLPDAMARANEIKKPGLGVACPTQDFKISFKIKKISLEI